jgi:hypothetical protein
MEASHTELPRLLLLLLLLLLPPQLPPRLRRGLSPVAAAANAHSKLPLLLTVPHHVARAPSTAALASSLLDAADASLAAGCSPRPAGATAAAPAGC